MSSSPYTTVLVGTDESDSSFRAVDRAALLAHEAGAMLVLACAYRLMSEREVRDAQEALGGDEYQVSGSTPADDVLRDAAECAKALGVTDLQLAAGEGDAVAALVDLAEQRSTDPVVIGNRGLNSLAGLVLGFVLANISHRASCDVLIVHTTGRGAKRG